MNARDRHEPAVTVGMPVRNGESHIGAALEGLLSQELHDIEILVADNASTDGTRDIVEEFRRADDRIGFLASGENRGIPWNWNRTVLQARAPLFMWHAADDVARPAHLARCRAELLAHPDSQVAFSHVLVIDAASRVVGRRDDEGLDFSGLSPSARVALFFRRDVAQVIGYGGVVHTRVLRELGGLPPYFGGDMVLAVALALRSAWQVVPEQLFMERRHDGQMSKLQGSDPVFQHRTYAPSSRFPVVLPQWLMTSHMVTSALAAPVSGPERLRALAAILRWWVLPNWTSFPYDVKRNVIHLSRGTYRGRYFAGTG